MEADTKMAEAEEKLGVTLLAAEGTVTNTIGQLAECLLAQLAENQAERFRKTVRAIDLAALGEQSFWSQHAAALEADAGPGAAVDGNGV